MWPIWLFPSLLFVQSVTGNSGTFNSTFCSNESCGENAECSIINFHPICSCLHGYGGDPLISCRKIECVLNSDCPGHLTCIYNKCLYSCPGTCGVDAACTVTNHIPACSCREGYTGDPYIGCRRFELSTAIVSSCSNGTCGDNAECSIVADSPVCLCLLGYSGNPLTSCKRAECLEEWDCLDHLTCRGGACIDACDGACPPDAACSANYHLGECSCPEGFYGNPFIDCRLPDPTMTNVPFCSIRTCGDNAECSIIDGRPACSCRRGYSGNPLGSCKRPECFSKSECPYNLTCLYNKCRDPCDDGTCGLDASCIAINHTSVCSCPAEYTGDPFTHCRRFHSLANVSSCSNATCGENAQCLITDDRPACACLHGYLGDPLISCKKAECLENSECSDHLSCKNGTCLDSCDGNACGHNAVCNVKSHKPKCSCPNGYLGNSAIGCVRSLIEERIKNRY